MDKKLFSKFKAIKDKIAALEAAKSDLEMQLFDQLDADGVNSYVTGGYVFARMGRKTYTYPEPIITAQSELAKQKKIAELSGEATLKSESQHIRVVPVKSEDQA